MAMEIIRVIANAHEDSITSIAYNRVKREIYTAAEGDKAIKVFQQILAMMSCCCTHVHCNALIFCFVTVSFALAQPLPHCHVLALSSAGVHVQLSPISYACTGMGPENGPAAANTECPQGHGHKPGLRIKCQAAILRFNRWLHWCLDRQRKPVAGKLLWLL